MLFQPPELGELELEVVSKIQETRRRLHHMLRGPRGWYEHLRRTSLARNLQASNSLDGHPVSLDDAVAVATGKEPMDADEEDRNALRNYRDAMTYVIQLAGDPDFRQMETALIRSLHFMMMRHDLGATPGSFRSGSVFVWSTESQEVIYEGPDFELVPLLVDELVTELNSTDAGPSSMVRAGMAHLNLILIQPFKDGNGRMARALQTLVLARDPILAPEFSGIEEYLGRNAPAYLGAVAEVGGGSWQPDRAALPWLRFVLVAHHRQALRLACRVREAERLWEAIDQLAHVMGIDHRNSRTLYDAALGFKIRRSDHIAHADVSDRVATSDLRALVDAGLLEPIGEKRGRFYISAEPLRELRFKTREPKTPIPDPFAEAARLHREMT